MNFARLAVAALTAWVASLAIGFVVNEVILADLYARQAGVMRPTEQAEGLLPVGFVGMLVGFFAFAYAYVKGYEGGNGVQEGLRYGVLVGLMLVCFSVVWQYIVFPISTGLLVAWAVDHIIEFAIYGVIVGTIYRPLPSRQA